MLKKLLITCLLLYSTTMGVNVGNVEAAETVVNNDTAVQQDVNLTEDSLKTPNEAVEDHQDAIENDLKETIVENGTTQNESTDTKGSQTQDKTGKAEVIQDQTADQTVCQEQTVHASVSCEGKLESDVKGEADQSQLTQIEAEQLQAGVSSEKVEAEQKQAMDLTSKQTQEVTVAVGENPSQSQDTNVRTSQSQLISAEEQAAFLQNQLTGIAINQRQQLSTIDSKVDEQKLKTEIEAQQTQSLSTSGSAKVEQTQTAEIKSNMVDTLKQFVETGVNVSSRNYVEIVKGTVNSVVKVFQEIMVNDALVDIYYHQFIIGGLETEASQHKYEKKFDWGNLVVENSAMVKFSEELQQFEATMNSFMGITFLVNLIGNQSGDQTDPNNGGDPVTPPPGENETPPQGGDNGGDPVTPPPSENEIPPQGGDNEGNPVTPPPGENETPPQGGDNEGNPVTTPQSEKGNVGDASVTSSPQENGQVSSDLNNEQIVKYNTVETKQEKDVVSAVPLEKANTLPVTASNLYNFLILGCLLITAGVLLSVRRKKVNQ